MLLFVFYEPAAAITLKARSKCLFAFLMSANLPLPTGRQVSAKPGLRVIGLTYCPLKGSKYMPVVFVEPLTSSVKKKLNLQNC